MIFNKGDKNLDLILPLLEKIMEMNAKTIVNHSDLTTYLHQILYVLDCINKQFSRIHATTEKYAKKENENMETLRKEFLEYLKSKEKE